MSDYTITTDFGAKDSLPSGNAAKIIKGSEFTTEFTNIKTAVNTKADTTGDTFTGAVTFDGAVTLNADVTFDTDTMFVDVSENRVGIGTTSPDYELDVTGSAQLSGGDLILRSDSSDADTQYIRFENYPTDIRTAYIRADYTSQTAGGGTSLAFGANDHATATDTDSMVIDIEGNVGIGTTSPSVKLHIDNGATSNLITQVFGGGSIYSGVGVDGTGAILTAGSSGSANASMIFRTASNGTEAEAMRIDSSGNVLVGKTSTGFGTAGIELHHDNQVYATSTTHGLAVSRLSTDGAVAKFYKDGTTVGSISVTGSATSYNTSSDERLKENIADSADAGSKVDAIQIRQFDWKADGSHQDYGVIAQELLEVAPEAVTEGETEEDMMGVDYSKLVPMLIKEVQSLRSRVAELENV